MNPVNSGPKKMRENRYLFQGRMTPEVGTNLEPGNE